MEQWTNWAGTVRAKPAFSYAPASVPELISIVQKAAATDRQIRVRGSGHSFTALASTNSVSIDLHKWRGIIQADRASGLVKVRAGTPLRQLNAELDTLGLALTNLGDIDCQTVSGALATGTHGTGAKVGGLATQIEQLEMILADGSIAICSQEHNPELFAAAKINLGALGIITAITLRCEPAFALAARENPEPLDSVIKQFDSLAAENDHFEFFWFPYGDKALVKRNNRLPVDIAVNPLSKARHFFDYEITENLAFGALCRLGRRFPGTGKAIGKITAGLLSAREYSDRSHRVLVTPRRVKFVESEFALPRESVGEALAQLRKFISQLDTPILFPIEVRVAAQDDIWLSTAYGRDSAYIAIHQFAGMPYQDYFAGFAEICARFTGRPHWGKLHNLDAQALRKLYPRFDDFRRIRAEVDPRGLFSSPYLSLLLDG